MNAVILGVFATKLSGLVLTGLVGMLMVTLSVWMASRLLRAARERLNHRVLVRRQIMLPPFTRPRENTHRLVDSPLRGPPDWITDRPHHRHGSRD